jgi:hypothetical protein
VNYAFSVELLLKAVLLHKKVKPWGHDLAKLQAQLLDDDEPIVAAVTARLGRSRDEIAAAMKDHAKVFEEWRYLHEKDDVLGEGYYRIFGPLSHPFRETIEVHASDPKDRTIWLVDFLLLSAWAGVLGDLIAELGIV